MEYFGTDLTECGHYRFELDGNYMVKTYKNYPRFEDLPFHPENLTNKLEKGEVVFYQGGGYTVLGISGSCKDERPGCKSVFWVKEIISKDQIIQKIRLNANAMKIIRAMPFDIKWNI